MAKNTYSKKVLIEMIGTLDEDEDGNFICTVETKDSFREYNVIEILEQMVGTEIAIKSISDTL